MHSKTEEYAKVLAVIGQARDMLRGVKVEIGGVGVGGLVAMWGCLGIRGLMMLL